jgi:uncharacterized protein HemY
MLTLDQIVEMNESTEKQPWNKLNKSLKLKRLMDFADRYSVVETLDDAKKAQLKQMLKDKLDKKCLQKIKDVVYNAEEERIERIPALYMVHNKYTLRSDSISPLSSLTPKTVKKEVKVMAVQSPSP